MVKMITYLFYNTNMHCRITRQIFYVLAAACMCTWICITFLVVRDGTKDTNFEEDVFTAASLDSAKEIADKTGQTQNDHGVLKWVNAQNKKTLASTPNNADVQAIEKDQNMNEDEVFDKVDDEQMNIDNNDDEKVNATALDQMKKKSDMLPINHTAINMLGKADEDVGGKQRFMTELVGKDKEKIEQKYRTNDSLKTSDDISMSDKKINAHDIIVRDSEEEEFDKAAKYKNFNNVHIMHEYSLDDGEVDNIENEDAIGDDYENKELSKDKNGENYENNFNDLSNRTFQENITKIDRNVNKNDIPHNNRNKEVVRKKNAVGDIVQQIHKFPKAVALQKISAINSKVNVKKDKIYYGDLPSDKLNEFRKNGDKMERDQSTDDGFDPVDEESMKKYDRDYENVNANVFDPTKKENDTFHATIDSLGNSREFDKKQRFMKQLKNNEKEKIERNHVTKLKDNENVSIKKMQAHDRTEIKRLMQNDGGKITKASGIGEMGAGVVLDYKKMSEKEKRKMQELYTMHGFNAYVSDMISVHRTLPDVRSEKCKLMKYDVNPRTSNLPQTSVIIVFHNEALSALMRTIISVINRSPDHLLKEIILVDDFSTFEDLKQPLVLNLSQIGKKVRLIRTKEHEGLIRARLVGTRYATAPVLTFLDAHVECFKGWLEPLLERLVKKPNTVVTPQIQTISDKTFKIGIRDKVYVGTFQLSNLIFDWIPIQYRDQQRRLSETDTARSPVFIGGLFSIYKSYFYKIGTYDKDMNLWGGENLELSFRVWMCGGSVEIHPCSNVAHVFRQTNPLEMTMKEEVDNAAKRNNLRTAYVWMDDFKKFYNEKGIEKIDFGNISDRAELRKQLHCKSFQWYRDNVYPGLYVAGEASLLGEVRNPAYGVCIDSDIDIVSVHIGVSKCSNKTSQFWHLSKLNALQREVGCIEYPENTKEDPRPTLERCDGGGPKQYWVYTKNGWLYNPRSQHCLGLTKKEQSLQILKCENNERFLWKWYNTGIEDKFTKK